MHHHSLVAIFASDRDPSTGRRIGTRTVIHPCGHFTACHGKSCNQTAFMQRGWSYHFADKLCSLSLPGHCSGVICRLLFPGCDLRVQGPHEEEVATAAPLHHQAAVCPPLPPSANVTVLAWGMGMVWVACVALGLTKWVGALNRWACACRRMTAGSHPRRQRRRRESRRAHQFRPVSCVLMMLTAPPPEGVVAIQGIAGNTGETVPLAVPAGCLSQSGL